METSIVGMKLVAAKDHLRLAQGQLDAAIQVGKAAGSSTDSLDSASGELREAALCIDAISADREAEPPPLMRACPSCDRSIRAQATLCGYCWTKQ